MLPRVKRCHQWRGNVKGTKGKPVEDSDHINVKEAAELVRVSEDTIRHYLVKRKLRRFKFGGRTLLSRAEVLGLIKEV
jgi:excisionase family DNA binding protein